MKELYFKVQPLVPYFFAWCVVSVFFALAVARLSYGWWETQRRRARIAERAIELGKAYEHEARCVLNVDGPTDRYKACCLAAVRCYDRARRNGAKRIPSPIAPWWDRGT